MFFYGSYLCVPGFISNWQIKPLCVLVILIFYLPQALQVSFLIKSSGCKEWCLKSQGQTEKNALLKHGHFYRSNQHLWYWSIFPFISCGSKEAGAKCIGCSVIISKGESLWTPKGVYLTFRKIGRTNFAQGIWRTSVNVANWVLKCHYSIHLKQS